MRPPGSASGPVHFTGWGIKCRRAPGLQGMHQLSLVLSSLGCLSMVCTPTYRLRISSWVTASARFFADVVNREEYRTHAHASCMHGTP